MTKFTDMYVSVGTRTSSAVHLTFHEESPEEQEEWIPLSLILDADGCCTVAIQKWILKEKGIEYDCDTDSADHRFK